MQSKRKRYTPWPDDAVALIQKLIHTQDMVIGATGLCINDVKKMDVRETLDYHLAAWAYLGKRMQVVCDDLIRLKDGRTGRPQAWFNLAEDSAAMAVKIQRAAGVIEKEKRANFWNVIQTRLEVCEQDLQDLQNNIIETVTEAVPDIAPIETPQITSAAMVELLNLVDTIQMGERTGGRWRRTNE